jgi:Glycosyl transferases group 1
MRLAVLSNDRLEPWVNWTTLGPPLLRPLASHHGARLVAAPPLRPALFGDWRRTVRDVWHADTLFWMQGSARPEIPVWAAALARGRAQRSAFVFDAWRSKLGKIGTTAVLQQLDPCFVAYREAADELARRFRRGRFEWLPFGADTDTFDAVPGERDIFAYWMGRRYKPLHEALIAYCAERRLEYRYTNTGGDIVDPADLGRLVGRSQYFLVTPPDLDNRAKTGGYSPLVMRYLEGLAAGARLLGVLPRSGEYDNLLPRDAILEVAPDGSDLAAKLDADRNDPGPRRAVERARRLVRSHHSWKCRAEQIYARLTGGAPYAFDLADALRTVDRSGSLEGIDRH